MFVRSRGLFAALLLVISSASLQAQGRIGYVDSRKILQEMPGRQQVEAKLRTDLEVLGAREKKMIDSLNVMMSAFEKDSATLSAADRTTRFAALQKYDAMYRDTLQALQTEAQTLQGEAMQPLFDQIKIALDDIRASDNLAMIFDIGGQSNPIVAMDRNLDISDKVIARLRTMPATRPTPAPARPAPAPAARPNGPVPAPAGVRRP
jgi:outer membrane protein